MRILSVEYNEYNKKEYSFIIVTDKNREGNIIKIKTIVNCTLYNITREEFVNIAININKTLNCDKFVCEDVELYQFIKEVYNGRL